MQVINLAPTTHNYAQAGFAKVEKSGNRVVVKFDRNNKVEFESYNGTYKTRLIMVDWSQTYIFDYCKVSLNEKERDLLTTAVMVLGVQHLYLNKSTGLYLITGDVPVTPQPQTALCTLKGATTLSQHRREPVRRDNSSEELFGAVLGLGLAVLSRRLR